MLTYKEVCELFTYNRETGALHWKKRTHPMQSEDLVAGCLSKGDGYLRVRVGGTLYLVHRIIMLLSYGHLSGSVQVDHINHIRTDNRLNNLRFVSNTTNARNSSINKNNTSGVCGVWFDKRRNKYYAEIKVDRKKHFLGYFVSIEKAAEARAEAEKHFKFHANHGK